MRLSDIQPIKLQHMPGGICAIDWHILPLPLGLTGGDLICKSSAPGEPAVSKLTRCLSFRPHGFVLMDKFACGNPGPGGAAIATAVLRERQITAELDDWLPGHVLPALSRAKLLGHYRGTDASAPMTLTVALNRSDEAGFQRYLQDVYDQHSKSYRHFLTPRQISDRFGPSRREYGSVISYLKRNRLAIVERYPNRMTVTVRQAAARMWSELSGCRFPTIFSMGDANSAFKQVRSNANGQAVFTYSGIAQGTDDDTGGDTGSTCLDGSVKKVTWGAGVDTTFLSLNYIANIGGHVSDSLSNLAGNGGQRSSPVGLTLSRAGLFGSGKSARMAKPVSRSYSTHGGTRASRRSVVSQFKAATIASIRATAPADRHSRWAGCTRSRSSLIYQQAGRARVAHRAGQCFQFATDR